MDKIEWIYKCHADVNQKYDGLPYEFHLRMAARIYEQFKELLDDQYDMCLSKDWVPKRNEYIESERKVAALAVIGHDLIEDAQKTYNDVANYVGRYEAEIIYAVSNEKGKTRKERANTKYYSEMRKYPVAVFVKLCDRIANVTYGKLMGGRMAEMYQKENIDFQKSLGRYTQYQRFEPMFEHLDNLFSDNKN